MRSNRWRLLLLAALLVTPLAAQRGEPVTVTGAISVEGAPAGRRDWSGVAVWLTPQSEEARHADGAGKRFRILQHGKEFEPHVLVVPVGATVDFPNLDPFFHNVFSLFDGRRFDLGLYESGASRSVTFPRAGICYLFCNIHPNMSATVVVVDTPYYATTGRTGAFTITGVPPGRYRLSLWHDQFRPIRPADFPRDVVVGAGLTLDPITLVQAHDPMTGHQNKFGHEYTPPAHNPLY